MQNKKVFLIRNVAPENYGGGETYQLMLSRELRDRSFEPVIISGSKNLVSAANKEKFRTITPPYNKTQNWSGLKNFLLPLYALWQRKLRKFYEELFEKEQPSVINIQSRDDWISATLAAKKFGIKVLWTDHMDFRGWALWNIDKKFKNPIGKRIAKLSKRIDKLIFISEHERDWFTSFPTQRNQKNLIVIHNGAKDRLKKYSNIRPVEASFCYVGRIVDYKGISELLEAFKKVQEKHNEATLNLYGEGPDLEKYKEESKNNKNIIFHGQTEEPLKSLAENKFFVLPSYREGLSLSLLDAAMMEKIIVTTDVGAAEEVVGRDSSGGFLIHPKDPKALEKAMLEALEDKTRTQKMAKTARKTFEEKFDFSKIFEEEMLPLYNINKN